MTRKRRSTTEQTVRAGESARVYNRLEELVNGGGLGAAWVREMFRPNNNQPDYSWRTAPLVEQSAGLARIELKLTVGKDLYYVDDDGYPRIRPYESKEQEERDRMLLFPYLYNTEGVRNP